MNSLYWPVYGRQVTTPAQLSDRITRLRVSRGAEGFARIGRTPSFTGGLLFLWHQFCCHTDEIQNGHGITFDAMGEKWLHFGATSSPA